VSTSFRHGPPRPRGDWIDRPRLTARLARRAELQVLVLVAPAGYGKTSVLAQAVAHAEEEGLAIDDIWLQCSTHDADPDVLGRALLRATGIAVSDTAAGITARQVTDALLRFAPRQVCLMLDDLHTIEATSGGMDLIRAVLEELPTNAHLVIASRTTPPLALSRRFLSGDAELIDRSQLEYDDDEMDRAFGGAAAGDEARWPALTHLQGHVAHDHPGVGFLLEEVARPLGPESVSVLAALSTIADIDDAVVRVASGGRFSIDSLIADLPLVHRSPDGLCQMHDLWRQALAAELVPEGRSAQALSAVAEHRLAQHRYSEAADLYALAGNREGVELAAREFSAQPLMFVSASEVRHMAALAAEVLGSSVVADMIAAALPHDGLERGMALAYEDVARRAGAAGDTRVEAVALQGAMNLYSILNPIEIPQWIEERAGVLAADGDITAATVHAIVKSHRARIAGDPERAARAIAALYPSSSPMAPAMLAFGLGDLGRPESVITPDSGGSGTDEDDLSHARRAAAQAGGQYLAQALWLRGDVSPEIALELGSQLASSTDGRGIPHLQVSTNAVLCFVALAAGAADDAQRFSHRADRWSAQTLSSHARSLAGVASAALHLCGGDAEQARARVREVLDEVPMGAWPARPYLYSLPLVYWAADDAERAVLDGCRFGVALTAARDAGRAIVALTEDDDPAPASALPWDRPDVLRAHVLPPHLALLAAAAGANGHGGVDAVLATLPDLRRHLGAAEELNDSTTVAWARDRRSRLPSRPDYDLRVDMLGPLVLRRGWTEVTEANWVRRERVQQLLAVVLLHGRISRRQAQEIIWPDLPPEKAAGNLRVNLTHLQKVLQPGRPAEDQPWFISANSEALSAARSGIILDTVGFERLVAEGRDLDQNGRTTLAIERFRAAAALYRGDLLLESAISEWMEVERVRLRSLATTTFARLGELVLARGEPEEASSWATRALRLEPLHERSERLFIRALLAEDNRAAAVSAARDLIGRLRADNLTPEHDTIDLAQRLGLRLT
jgi:LuxR family transcriptional regulator, maltose regulon positive regulatory protein